MKQRDANYIEMRRCKCPTVEFEEVPGLAQCLRCVKCRGWVAMRLSTMEDLARFRECFAPIGADNAPAAE